MKFKENKICFKINYFVENILKVKSFATKITLMFSFIFILSIFVSFGFLSYIQIKEDFEEAKKHVDLATSIRQNLSLGN